MRWFGFHSGAATERRPYMIASGASALDLLRPAVLCIPWRTRSFKPLARKRL